MHDLSSRVCHLCLFVAVAMFAAGALAAPPLFPEPLHLTRVVETPFGGATTIEEFCQGNRIATVIGMRTIVVDYDKQTVTEISRADATYSVTSFSDVAAATAPSAKRSTLATKSSGANDELRTIATPAGRDRGHYFAVEPKAHAHIRKMEIGVDERVALSREAVEALLGASFPNAPTDEAQLALRASAEGGKPAGDARAKSAGGESRFALPLEQRVQYDAGGGKEFVVTNRVTRVGNELAPNALAAIPPGAHAVESHFLRTRRELDELDHLPPNP
ncbi:MAG TPA: hypothetical protein VF824_10555 [Thermoanaerobaculia bacterium]